MKKLKPEIVHEDADIVVVNKPPHMLSIPDRYEPEKENLMTWLSNKYGEIFTVHRLDKETSGILVFARNEQAHKDLSRQFQARTVTKIYSALTEGTWVHNSGVIDAPLLNNLSSSGKVVVHQRMGKASETHYYVVEQFRDYAMVAFDLKTGRTHQIRVHTLHAGHPLITDPIYGKRAEFFLSSVKKKKYSAGKYKEERPLLSRSALHAQSLTFQHPGSREEVNFSAELPKDMRATLAQLRKWNKV